MSGFVHLIDPSQSPRRALPVGEVGARKAVRPDEDRPAVLAAGGHARDVGRRQRVARRHELTHVVGCAMLFSVSRSLL